MRPLQRSGADDSMGSPESNPSDPVHASRPVQRLPIIGQSVATSPAEAVQRAAFEAAEIEVAIERWERKPHQLADAVAELRDSQVIGALIAAPHKERAAAMVDTLSDDARASGAVNLIVRDGERLRGHNTDLDGVRAGLASILPAAPGKAPRHAVLLGAGGGARAVVTVLIGSGIGRLAVFNRHLHKAEALVAHFARSARQTELRALPWHETFIGSELGKANLVINASGIGVEEGETPIPADLLPADLYLLDLVLNHELTPLMREVRARGGTAANGQGSMLVASGETFRLLTGRAAPDEVLRTALAAELGLPEERLAVVGD